MSKICPVCFEVTDEDECCGEDLYYKEDDEVKVNLSPGLVHILKIYKINIQEVAITALIEAIINKIKEKKDGRKENA